MSTNRFITDTEREEVVDIARRAGLVVVAIAAVWLWFNLEPSPLTTRLTGTEVNRLVGLALSDFEANEALADSAPQQQVVNGWVARDLLQVLTTVEAAQLQTIFEVATSRDERIPALIGLVTVAFCWWGLFGPVTDNATTLPPPTSRQLQSE